MEFFPPKTDDGLVTLRRTVEELEPLDLSFVSVTYGAGGSTRDRTRDLVVELNRDRPYPAMAHLTCMGHTRGELDQLLADYDANGVHNILALAGDPPADGSPVGGDFTYADELVELVRSHGEQFAVGVAAHPELHPRSTSRAEDRRHLARKLESADFAMTQFFFDPDDYFRMVDELAALGCTKPVVPGVMPLTNPAGVKRMADDVRRHVPGGPGGPGGGRGGRGPVTDRGGGRGRTGPGPAGRRRAGAAPLLPEPIAHRAGGGGGAGPAGLRPRRRDRGQTFLPAGPGMRRGRPGRTFVGLGGVLRGPEMLRKAKGAQGRGPARRRSVRFDGADEAALVAQIRAWVATDRKRLGEVLLELGAIHPDDLIGALSRQREVGGGVPAGPDGSDPNAPAPDAAARLGRLLVDQGVITEVDLAAALAEQFGVPLADLRTVSPEQAAIDRIPEELARKHGVIPLRVEDERVYLAAADPLDVDAINELTHATGRIGILIGAQDDITRLIDQSYDALGRSPGAHPGLRAHRRRRRSGHGHGAGRGRERPRRAGGQPAGVAGRAVAGLGHPHRAPRGRGAGALPGGRRAVGGDHAAGADGVAHRQPDQGDGRAQHRGAPPPPGRPVPGVGGRPPHRHPGLHRGHHPR